MMLILKRKEDFSIENTEVSATFFGSTGILKAVKNKRSGVSTPVVQELMNYINGPGGAYVLLETQSASPFPKAPQFYVISGPILQQVIYFYDENTFQSISLYSDPYDSHTTEVFFYCNLLIPFSSSHLSISGQSPVFQWITN